MSTLLLEFDGSKVERELDKSSRGGERLAATLDKLDAKVRAYERSVDAQVSALRKRTRDEKASADGLALFESRLVTATNAMRRLEQEELRGAASAERYRKAVDLATASAQARETVGSAAIPILKREMAEQDRLTASIERIRRAREVESRTLVPLREQARRAEAALNDARVRGAAALRDYATAEAVANAQAKAHTASTSAQGREIESLTRRIRTAQQELGDIGKKSESVGSAVLGSFKSWALGFASITVAFAAIRRGISEVAEASAEFGRIETALVSVQKTTELSGAELKQFHKDILDLATGSLPIATEELIGIASAAGQVGVKGRKNLLEYVETLGQLSKATDIVGRDGTASIARLMTTQGELPDQVSRVGSALAYMDANAAASASEILHMATEIGRATGAFRIGSPAAIGLGAALKSMGAQAEGASTSVGRTMREMQSAISEGGVRLSNFAKVAGVTEAELKRVFDKSPLEAFLLLLRGASAYGENATIVFEKLGLGSDRLARNLPLLATNYASVEEKIRQATDAAEDNVYLSEKSAIAFDTQESRAQRLDNAVQELRRSVGEELAPALETLNTALLDLAKDGSIRQFFLDLASAMKPALEALGLFLKMSGYVSRDKSIRANPRGASAADLDAQIAANDRMMQWMSRRIEGADSGSSILSRDSLAYKAMQRDLKILFKENYDLSRLRLDLDRKATAEAREQATQQQASNAAAQEELEIDLEGEREQKKAAREQERQNDALGRAILRIKDAEAEVLEIRRKSSAVALPLDEQIEYNRQLEVERRIREESRDLRRMIADKNTLPGVRQNAVRALQDLRAATLAQVAAEEELAGAQATDEITRSTQAALSLADAYGQGERAAQLATIAEQKANEIREVAIRTGGNIAAISAKKAEIDARQSQLAAQRTADIDRQAQALGRSLVAELSGADAVEAARREEELRQQVLQNMVGLEEKWQSSIDASVKRLHDYRDALKAAQAVGGLAGDAEFARRLSGISNSNPRLRQLEEQYLGFLRNLGHGSVREGERLLQLTQAVLTKMGAGFIDVAALVKSSLEDLQLSAAAAQQRGAGSTSKQRFDQEIQNERDIASFRIRSGEKRLDVEADLAQRERDLTEAKWRDILSLTSSSLQYLGDRFGGFFASLNQAVNALQRVQGFSQSASQLTGYFTNNSSTVASAGYVGAVVAVFAEVYSFVDKMIQKERSLRYGIEATYAEGSRGGSYFDEQGQRLFKSMRDLVRSIEESLGISIDELERIGINVRNDGKKAMAYVNGVLMGVFSDVNEAIREAVRIALQSSRTSISGIDDLVRQGLSEFNSPDLDEMLSFMRQLTEIANLGKTQGAIQLESTLQGLDRLMETLSHMREMTPAVAAGFDNLVMAEGRAWQAWSDAISGRQQTDAERLQSLQQEARLMAAQRQLRLAELRMRLEEALAQAAAAAAYGRAARIRLQIDRDFIAGFGGGGAAFRELANQEIDLMASYLNAKAAGVKAEAQIQQSSISVLDAYIAALRETIASIEAVVLPDPNSIRLPGAGGGRRQQRESLEEELRGIIRDAMPDLARALADGRDEIARLEAEIARLGPDSELAAAALETLRENLGRDLRNEIEGILSDDTDTGRRRREITDYWNSVRRAVEDHLKATGEQLVSFFDITEAEARQLAEVTRQLLDGLGIPYFDSQRRMREFDDLMRDLFESFQDGTLDATQLMIAIEGLGDEIYQTLLSGMAQYIQDAGTRERVERQLREMEYDAKKAIWAAELEFYRLRGALTQEEYDFLAGVLRSLPEDLPIGDGGGGGGGFDSSSGTDIMEERRRFEERLRDILELDLSPIEREYRQLQREIEELMAEGRRLGFSQAELMAAQQALIRDFWNGVTEPIRDFYDSLDLSDLSPLTDAQRFAEAQREAFSAVAAASSGDLEAIQSLPDVLRQYLETAGQNFGTAGGGYQDIFAWVREVLARFSTYQGGSVQIPQRPGTANLLPFRAEPDRSTSQLIVQAQTDQRSQLQSSQRLLDATIEQNRILRDILRSQEGMVGEVRLSNRLKKAG